MNADKAVVYEMLCSEFSAYSNLVLDRKKVFALYDLLINGGRLQLYGNIFAEVKKDYLRFYRTKDCLSKDAIEITQLPFEMLFGNYVINLEKNTNNLKKVFKITTYCVI